jgi:hypothetical protein
MDSRSTFRRHCGAIKTRWGDVARCTSARLVVRVSNRGCPVGKSAGAIPEFGGVEVSTKVNWRNWRPGNSL